VAIDRSWAFISSHGAVLIEVARAPQATVRELAERAHITERQAHRVLNDLCAEGYVTRQRVGRRNEYHVNDGQPMRHPSVAEHKIGELLDLLARA
jgi:predicted ArsR family transcriptional regulator